MEKTKHKEDIQNPTWYEQTLQDLQNNCSHRDCAPIGIDVYKCNLCGKVIDVCEEEDC